MLRQISSAFQPGATAQQVAIGLRGAMLLVYASQVGFVVVGVLLVNALVRLERVGGWGLPFNLVAFVLYASTLAATNTKETPTLSEALRFTILLGAATSIPAVLAAVLLVLGGPLEAATMLPLVLGTLGFSLARLTNLQVQSVPQPEVFEGFPTRRE